MFDPVAAVGLFAFGRLMSVQDAANCSISIQWRRCSFSICLDRGLLFLA
jgi:hypothetical protein